MCEIPMEKAKLSEKKIILSFQKLTIYKQQCPDGFDKANQQKA